MHREELTTVLQAHFYKQPAQTWVDLIHAVKVPVGMINNLKQTLKEEQVLAREMVIQMPHTLREDYTSIGSPIKLSKTPVEYKKAPPCLGEDTDVVLSQFLSPDEIDELKSKKVIQQR